MRSFDTRTRVLTTLPSLALLLVAATACGADEIAQDAAENAAERALEEAASSEGVDVDVDTDDGTVRVETSDGTFSTGTGELPDGFPEDIPVLDAEILQGMSTTTEGSPSWLVTVAVDRPGDEALAEAGAALEGADYAEGDNSMAMEGIAYVQYVGSEHEIVLGATDDGEGGTLLSYTVTAPTS